MICCRLITLDIMGTVLTSRAPVGVHYAQVGEKFGVSANPKLLTENFKNVWNEMKVVHPNYGRNSGLGWENWWKTLVHETFSKTLADKKVASCTLNDIADHLVHMFKYPEYWRFCDGAIEFMNYASKKQIPLAVLSNFDERLEVLLNNMKIKKYFRFVVTSYAAGFEKPDERIFTKVEDIANSITELKGIKKSEIVHIGDTPELDFIPAKKAGWNAFLISNDLGEINNRYPNISNEFVIKNLHELKELL